MMAHLSKGSDLLVQSKSLDMAVSRCEEHHQQLLAHQQWVALQIVCKIFLGGREGGREEGKEGGRKGRREGGREGGRERGTEGGKRKL